MKQHHSHTRTPINRVKPNMLTYVSAIVSNTLATSEANHQTITTVKPPIDCLLTYQIHTHIIQEMLSRGLMN